MAELIAAYLYVIGLIPIFLTLNEDGPWWENLLLALFWPIVVPLVVLVELFLKLWQWGMEDDAPDWEWEGPDEPDGPWAEGWDQRSGLTPMAPQERERLFTKEWPLFDDSEEERLG